ncbi:sulfoxide reductase heme-binding subunit YedZ [Pikeienuella piscinae]|uniref:Protein-methionine-sulfoxide reductase heme-binding subunit MsrQ n=1 Tax=Pikeienuella piscinae TaxID=2748098 RepID=A0A7L5BXF0_9RHOB|nr:protein-methionine-sulfoxide reductase heme-binding subunit MsrQ [Pikeienuella piscinae]QIE57050.1 sulfoxide reductase heme-binding subunit YedZ [Pikeienuella piscinae]
MKSADLYPWADRAGRFSPLRAAVFAALVAPGLWIAAGLAMDMLGPEPVKSAEHLTGVWTLRILLIALAVTPLRRRLGWSRLIGVRRMIGVAAFAYVLTHFGFYILYLNGDLMKAASEIVSRLYLAIGFVALLGLAALAATSFDAAIRRMGPNWRRLHMLAYPLTLLGVLHYFLQSKIDVGAPALLFGVFAGLMLHRAFARAAIPPALVVIGVALLSGAAAALGEYLWHAVLTGIPADRVFMANFDFRYDVRPPWLAMAIMAAPLIFLPPWRRAVQRARALRGGSAPAFRSQ